MFAFYFYKQTAPHGATFVIFFYFSWFFQKLNCYNLEILYFLRASVSLWFHFLLQCFINSCFLTIKKCMPINNAMTTEYLPDELHIGMLNSWWNYH